MTKTVRKTIVVPSDPKLFKSLDQKFGIVKTSWFYIYLKRHAGQTRDAHGIAMAAISALEQADDFKPRNSSDIRRHGDLIIEALTTDAHVRSEAKCELRDSLGDYN